MLMDYITTTQLRTQTKQLVNQLKMGKKITLIHRSQKIGVIQADQDTKSETDKPEPGKLTKLIRDLKLPKLSDKQRAEKYLKSLAAKHG